MAQASMQDNYLLTHTVSLPVPGKVLVHLGQEIEVGGLIAEATLPAEFQVFDVLNQFRIEACDLEGCIKRLAGEEVQKGDVIARKPGLVSRIFRAPQAGKVVSVRDGRVTLAMGEKTIQAFSPIAGVVAEIKPGIGAQIGARGKVIQAQWGNGKIGTGLLLIVERLRDFDLKDLAEKVIVLNEPLQGAAMDTLAKASVAGLVVASLDPLRAKEFANWPIPLISLAGFGETTLDNDTKTRLQSFQDQRVVIVANDTKAFQAKRPCLFLPNAEPAPAALFEENDQTLLGSRVRFLGMPYFGSLGNIIEIPKEEERLGSGVLSRVVVVKRDDESIIRVPLENLEILSF